MSSATAPTTGTNESGYLDLENELTCSICTDVLFQPLTLLDCLHTFCGSCLKEWFTWQTAAARQKRRESGRSPQTVYTCPSCRAAVRETRPNATVTTLLEMYLRANPSKAKTEDEKKQIAKHYKVGDSVLPPPLSPLPERAGQPRRDAEAEAEHDRLLVDEVRRASLRELEERGTRNNRGERDRERDARNRRRDEMLAPNSRPAERSVPREHRRERAERSPRPSQDQPSSSRSLEHQSSLRSLISSSDLESHEMEEEIMRQIMEEGLLDGIDLSNINRREEDEISERIAQAYRRRQRERTSGGETSASNRTTGRARERERERTGGPPSSYHPERTTPAPRNGQRSSSQGSSSSTRLANPARSSGDNLPRTNVRSVSETSYQAEGSNNIERGHRRMLSHERRSTDPAPARSSEDARTTTPIPSSSNSTAAAATAEQPRSASIPTPNVIHAAANSTSVQPRSTVEGLQQEQRQPQSEVTPQTAPLISPPMLYCSNCSKPRIQYELHYRCSKCPSTTGSDFYAVCRHCYRSGKGCQNWYGFGRNAWSRYHHQKSQDPTLPPPHILTAEKFVRRTSETASDEDASTQCLVGVFCDVCSEHANDCYWRCATCNDGEWGFCNACVNQARHCNHPLVPLFWSSFEGATQLNQTASLQAVPTNSSDPVQLTALPIHTTCNSCSNPIPPSTTRYHCPKCNDGDYDICSTCYTTLISANKISRENGPQGWRKCEAGHRMLLIGFESKPEGQRRLVVEHVVGGWQMRDEDADLRLTTPATQANSSSDMGPSTSSEAQWSWRDPTSGTWKSTRHTAPSSQAPPEAPPNRSASFPPSGGHGAKMTALWTRIPDEGVDDELTFPRGAQITEVVTINEDWCWGIYCGRGGLFPHAYGRIDR